MEVGVGGWAVVTWWACPMWKPCQAVAAGAWEDLLVGLTWSAVTWLALLLGLGLGRRSGRV